MPAASTLPLPSQQRIVRRVFRLRSLGLGLGLLAVLTVLHEQQQPGVAWALAMANALLWPWAARQLALVHPQPLRIEDRSQMVDAGMTGLWAAVMQFSPVPSLIIGALLLMGQFAFGGPRLAARCAALMAGAALLGGALNGFAVDLRSAPVVVLACAPLLLAYPAAIAHAVHRMSQKMRHQADRLAALERDDALTGLCNRRGLEEALRHEYRRFRRNGHPAIYVVLDLDHFQHFNTTWGREGGDTALRTVAELLRRTLRDVDTLARLDGDRFALVIPDISGRLASELVERVRQAASRAELIPGTGLTLSASAGWAEVDRDMPDLAAWMAAADTALFEAKALGRNRSRMAHRGGVGA
jgi:diguanylate cyclase